MTRFAALVLLFGFGTLAACEHGEGGYPPFTDAGEPGLTPAPRGGGFCCPIDPPRCDCFRRGGWVTSVDDKCEMVCDLLPFNTSITTDEHGCERLRGSESCLPG